MSRTIVKSFIYAPAHKRVVLHADFTKEELIGYSVRVIDGWAVDGPDTGEPESEVVEYFLPDAGARGSIFAAYATASERFKALVAPML